jgi:hypothetical protein
MNSKHLDVRHEFVDISAENLREAFIRGKERVLILHMESAQMMEEFRKKMNQMKMKHYNPMTDSAHVNILPPIHDHDAHGHAKDEAQHNDHHSTDHHHFSVGNLSEEGLHWGLTNFIKKLFQLKFVEKLFEDPRAALVDILHCLGLSAGAALLRSGIVEFLEKFTQCYSGASAIPTDALIGMGINLVFLICTLILKPESRNKQTCFAFLFQGVVTGVLCAFLNGPAA